MADYGHLSDRYSSFILYAILTLIVAWSGSKLLNYSTDSAFYRHYLLKWETALTTLHSKNLILPRFTGINHVEYMDNLLTLMENNEIAIIKSNTMKPYVYQIKKIGKSQGQKIFLLYHNNQIILYGLSKPTFNMLDKLIDHQNNQSEGRFKGKLQMDGEHYACVWEI